MGAADVVVVTEHLEGRLADTTFEALAAGRSLADGTGGEVVALLGGAGNAGLVPELGAADRVLHLDDPSLDRYSPEAYGVAIRGALGQREWRVVLVPNTTVGMDLAAGLAGDLGLPLVAYCTGVRIDGGTVVATAQIYGGKILAEIALAGRGVLSIVPGSFPVANGKREGGPTIERVAVEAAPSRVRVLDYAMAEAAGVDITKESVLVSVGRGIGGAENVPLAEELAAALGGVVSASRPVTDSGWLPRSRQVGKSGVTVKPRLYLALGISGAPEHLQGMKDSELIIAVNSDPSAPIFGVAHYGIVGDVLEVAPAITERLGRGA